MKKRTVIIIVSIIAAVILIGVLAINLIPRFTLSALIKTTLPEFESAQMFEHYNVTDSTLKPVSCENYSIGIPSEFTQVDTGELSAQYYANSDKSQSVMLVENSEPLDLDLLDDDIYKDIDGMPSYIAVANMEKAFTSLGNDVLPNNTYNTYKAVALLDSGDYNFWSIENTTAYIVLGTIKTVIAQMGETQYIYERDDVRCIVTIKEPFEENPVYSATVDLYSESDLDTPHTLLIRSAELNDIYSILNSIEFN